MNAKCIAGWHDWRFAYNHGMPFGISSDDAMKMHESGKTFEVHQCLRCGKQACEVNGRKKQLPARLVEKP